MQSYAGNFLRFNFFGTKLFAVLMLLLSQQSFAEPLSASEDEIEHIVITASRTPQNINQVMAAVEVITRNDIEKLQPQSLADLLTLIAGLDVTRQGGPGQQSATFTRGTGSDHTLILIDGIRTGSATLGIKALESLPVAQIERIEVVKGPRASLWGSDAIGGVINIFTRRLNQGEYQLGTEVGSHGYVSANGQIGVGYQGGSSTLSLSGEDSSGFNVKADSENDDDGYDRLSAALRGDYLVNDQIILDWTAQIDDGANEYDNIYGANQSDYKNYLWQLRSHYHKQAWTSTLAIAQSRDYSKSYGNGISKDQGDFFETRRNQINWLNQYQLYSALSMAAGVDYYEEKINGNTRYADNSRDVGALFANVQFNDQTWLAEAALRYDDVENIDSEVTYNTSLGYHLTEKLLLAVNVGHSFKAPTFNDLYYPESFGSKGNPNLKSETADSYELLMRSRYAGINATFSLYRTDIDDLIEWICDANWNCMPENVNKVEIKGSELALDYRALGFGHRAALSYVDAEDKTTGTQLIRRARKTGSYQLTYDWQDFELLGQYEYHGSRTDAGQRLDAYQLVTLGVSYYLTANLTLHAKASNLFDEQYQNVAGYYTPGAEYFAGISYKRF